VAAQVPQVGGRSGGRLRLRAQGAQACDQQPDGQYEKENFAIHDWGVVTKEKRKAFITDHGVLGSSGKCGSGGSEFHDTFAFFLSRALFSFRLSNNLKAKVWRMSKYPGKFLLNGQ
jgi:hypothetical protein